jgi:ATP-binding cassette subfamily B multidrug efflux pump
MKRLAKFKPYLDGSMGLLAFSLVCAFLATGSKLAIPFLAGKAVNEMVNSKSVDFERLGVYITIMSVLLVVGTIFRYVFDYLIAIIGQRVIKKMRTAVFASFMDVPISYIDQNEQGNLLLRLINDVENVQNGLITGGAALYDGVIAILFTMGFMFSLNWALTLIVLVLTPLSIVVSRFVSRWNSKYFKAQASSAGKLTGYSLESLTNQETVTTLGISSSREEGFDSLSQDFKKNTFKASFGASLINPSTRLVNNIINAVLITCGSLFIVNNVNLGITFFIGDLSAFLTYAASYMQPFNEISDVMAEISYAAASFDRIDKVVNAPKDKNEGKIALNEEINTLEAKNLNFSYDGVRPIIKNFSLDVYKGHKIALVGPTGCGKTTIINLLLRFYDPQEGAFYTNNISTEDLEKSSLRHHIGMVLQETWIFKGSVKENIAYAKPETSMDEIVEAAKRAQANEFIERLPQGYNTIISDSSGLSLGEKQLICVARVMLAKAEVVVLDEATSNIDIRTENLLNSSFTKLMDGKTSFVVAHRLSTIQHSDLILVMKDGEIIEQGNHQELLAKKGFYYSLYSSQFE